MSKPLDAYQQLLARKKVAFEPHGLTRVPKLNAKMFPHQQHSTEFALRAGCAALFLDTGLGKSLCALDWGRVIVEKTNKPVLMLAPLAVGPQHQREADKFDIEARYVREPEQIKGPGIWITNYERLEKFDASQFSGVILDESSILKSFTGKTAKGLIDTFADTPFRLACTATPAPNDHTELGAHADLLGVMEMREMLSRFFVNDTSEASMEWRIKGHAVEQFWDWVASWSRCIAKPSDLGFSDDGFVLPELIETYHMVTADRTKNTGDDEGQIRLFRMPENSATSVHREKRMTVAERARIAAEVVFGDWGSCGDQRTQNGVEQLTNRTLRSVSAEKGSPEQQKKTGSICEPTTPTTKNGGPHAENAPENSATRPDANAMPQTPPTAKNAKRQLETDVRNDDPSNAAKRSGALMMPSLVASSPHKGAGAPSAAQSALAAAANGSLLTTAMQQGACVGYSAPTATKASVSLPTIQNGCGERLSTSNERDWWVIWCHSDYEQDELERLFGDAAFSIKGSHSAERKEEMHEAWLRGERKALICKPVMFGWGLNWQHCHKMFFVGLSFSYESYYQAIRRCWRFGQTRPVHVHIAMADTERNIFQAVRRKSEDHDIMKAAMGAAMLRAHKRSATKINYRPTRNVEVPRWLV